MKHRHGNRILSRSAHHRSSLLKSLGSSLLRHRSLVTTEAKGKELRRVIEPLITEAKKELTLHRRRQLLQQLLHESDLELLLEVAESAKARPGGYIRITKLPRTRHDGAATVRVDILPGNTAQ